MTKKAQILEMLKAGIMPRAIAHEIGCSPGHVYNIRARLLGPSAGYPTEIYAPKPTNHAARRAYYAAYHAKNRERRAAQYRARKASQEART